MTDVPTPAPPTDTDSRLIATPYDGEADLVTIHPANPSDAERLSAWLTAEGEAYVSLAAWR